MDGSFHRVAESQWISSRPCNDNRARNAGHGRPVNLVLRQIYEWRRLLIQAGYFAVARHADHREPFVRQVRIELLAQRFLMRPVLIHKSFTHDHHALRAHRVLQREVAPLHNGNLQGPEIVRRDEGHLRLHGFVCLRHVPLGLHAR